MREILKGWRRKAGVVTLAMACALMSLWFRSQSRYDMIAFSTTFVGHHGQELESVNGCLTWSRRRQTMTDTFEYDSGLLSPTSGAVGFGDGIEDAGQSWFVPYLAVAVPMTLLSAFLILWKPRKASRITQALQV